MDSRVTTGATAHYGAADLRDLCVALDDARFAVHAHAIGDRAVREVLDALTAARRINGPRDGRHQISHLQFVDPADLPRFRALGVIANCQPYWAVHGGAVDDLARPLVGDERADRMYPFGSLARLGCDPRAGQRLERRHARSDAGAGGRHPADAPERARRRRRSVRPPSACRSTWRCAPTRAARRYANGLDDLTGTIEDRPTGGRGPPRPGPGHDARRRVPGYPGAADDGRRPGRLGRSGPGCVGRRVNRILTGRVRYAGAATP